MCSVADPGFPRGGGANSPGGGRQHTILPKFPKNCMKLKEFGPPGGARVQNFTMWIRHWCCHKQRTEILFNIDVLTIQKHSFLYLFMNFKRVCLKHLNDK